MCPLDVTPPTPGVIMVIELMHVFASVLVLVVAVIRCNW